ncbi:hypothetical protein TNCV_1046161 [Trichonephila clavipes]|nr:hypothetical protein TNCV_1046161 [Trichonephila clavipes]
MAATSSTPLAHVDNQGEGHLRDASLHLEGQGQITRQPYKFGVSVFEITTRVAPAVLGNCSPHHDTFTSILRPAVLSFFSLTSHLTIHKVNTPLHMLCASQKFSGQHDYRISTRKLPLELLWKPRLKSYGASTDVLEHGGIGHHTAPMNFTELWTALANNWQVIPVEPFQNLFEFMSLRVAAVIKSRAGPTRY